MTKRKFEVITRWPGIYRILVWNSEKESWEEPKRGKKFKVGRSINSDTGTARLFRYFRSFEEAKAFRSASAPGPAPELVEERASTTGMTFTELVKEWKENWLPNRELTTQIRYLSYLQHFDFLKDRVVEEIKATDIDKWIAHVKKPEYLARFHSTRCSYSHEFTVLRGILGYYASRHNRNYALPFLKEHVADLKVRDKPEITKDLTVEQMQKFLQALHANVQNTKYEVIYYLALMQYLIYGRIQEAAALHYESFDFAGNKIRVDKKVQWIRKKGMANRIVDGAKANSGKTLDMSAHAARLFKEWTLKSGVRSGSLFLLEGEIIPYRVIEYRYSKALKIAGLPFKATHILRHAALTEYYEGCKDLLATAKVAGHDDLDSTKRYTENRSETLARNQKQMDEKLASIFAAQNTC